jgi:hypothetical protein
MQAGWIWTEKCDGRQKWLLEEVAVELNGGCGAVSYTVAAREAQS